MNNLDDAMNQMNEASKRGFTMNAEATVTRGGVLPKDMAISETSPTPNLALNELAKLTGDWTTANKVLAAIEGGKLPGVVTFEHIGGNDEIQLAVLGEVVVRMMETKQKASDAHAAWNPAEVVTGMMLEIETGKYGEPK